MKRGLPVNAEKEEKQSARFVEASWMAAPSSASPLKSAKARSLKRAIQTAQISVGPRDLRSASQSSHLIPSAAQDSVGDILSKSVGASGKAQVSRTSIILPDSNAILSICYVERLNRCVFFLSFSHLSFSHFFSLFFFFFLSS